MGRISSTLRLAIGLACLSITVVLGAQSLGLIPDGSRSTMEGRASLCESISVDCSLFAANGDTRSMEASLRANFERNPDILTIAVRLDDGSTLVSLGELPAGAPKSAQPISFLQVPITAGRQLWGTVEIGFVPVRKRGWRGFFSHPLTRLTLFVAITSLAVDFLYLRRLLQQLDPLKVVPDRVRTTLDTLAEGLVVMDADERIVLANQSFANTVGRSADDLQGHHVSDLAWRFNDKGDNVETYPWRRAISTGQRQSGDVLGLETDVSPERKFIVNTSPIMGEDGEYRGVLASFDDITSIESSRAELGRMLQRLKQSRDEVQRKNEQLELLATRDPLTSCLNRRSFFEHFEIQWANAERYGNPLSFVMVDVDHFKSINDEHGHSTGDLVLQKLANVLQSTVRDGDVVCRYGGEEFCVLLPHLNIENACRAAERYRQAVESTDFSGLSVNASLGVSSNECGAANAQALIDQADKCLYVAKRNGRNQVARWDRVPQDLEVDESKISREGDKEETESPPIPFHAVTALVSALSYRDTSTAEHSRRVADLCVAVASRFMSVTDTYVLETAALLHDIGKIGVPDSILLKPGPLTEEEWKLMGVHDDIGVEIIKSSFACEGLTAIIENHHAWFGGSPRSPELPTGKDIPLGARILSIADAYDAMVSDRVYRKGRSREEAFAELRRCANVQFDPEIIETFVECVIARDDSRNEVESPVSKQTALRIGLQIESLASAVDNHDISELINRANHLKALAAKFGVSQIADTAEQLQQEATGDQCDEMKILQLTDDLLQLCRSTQLAYLGDEECSGETDALNAL